MPALETASTVEEKQAIRQSVREIFPTLTGAKSIRPKRIPMSSSPLLQNPVIWPR
jgi:hypothetical protein